MGLFKDRKDAGRRLAERLPPFDPATTVIAALPRGGVPVGAVIAETLGLPLEVLLIRKVGMPGRRELALGAVSDGNGDGMQVTVNDKIAAELGLTHNEVIALAKHELPEIERRRKLYFGDRPPVPLHHRTVIVVDDGMATGATARQALRLLKGRDVARIILAVPVAPPSTVAALSGHADEVICLMQPEPFFAVGSHYEDFEQLDDDEVVEIVHRLAATEGTAGMASPTGA